MAEKVTHTLHWVQGNTVHFAIPLQQEIQTPNGKVVQDYYPYADDIVNVFMCGKYLSTQIDCTVNGNVVIANDNGNLKTGVYGVEICIAKSDGTNLRSMWNYQVEIHKTNDGVLTEWNDFVAPDSQSLDSAIFFFAKGDDGITPHIDDTTGNWFIGDEDTGVHAQGEAGTTDYNELDNKPDLSIYVEKDGDKVLSDNNYTDEEKTKLAGLENYDDTNVLNLIEQTNQNFANYYTKAQTYSQSEVNQLLETQRQGQYVVVNELPVTSADTMFKIYLVPSSDPQTSNIKDEYITIDNGSEATTRYTWEKIGSTAVDLSGYSTTEEMNAAIQTALADYYTKTEADALLGGKQDTISDLSTIRSGAQAGATAYQKPTNGIPKTDLAQDVKDSLDKADSALQEDTLYGKVNNNGHEYVDLGLPSGTLWAKCNVGADAETGYGNYYMYGKGARQYNSSDSPYTGTEDPLDSSVDTAAQVWGGSWHMPTRAQMEELTANTTYQWVTNYKGSGINGGTFTATNGAVLFFPAAGFWNDGSQYDVGNYGYYWGSSPNGSNNAYNLYFGNGDKGVDYDYRKFGYSVRGVLLPDTTQLKQDLDSKANTEDLADVAFSGSYNDLEDKPTIPTVPTNVSAFNNDAGYLTQHQDISGKANKSEMSVVDGTGTDADKTTITLKTGTSATVLKSHQSLSGKQDVIDSSHKLSADLVDDTNTTNKFTNATEKQTWNNKQDALVSGTNIKTINNESVLGGGNINIVTELPNNLAYTSNDNGEGIIPSDGIRAVTVTSAATMTISPDVVTVIDGAVGTAAITLQVPQDNLAHVWDVLLTTGSTVAITFAMSNSATILTPSGFSIGASKAVEISVIGVGTKYYLRYGEFA